MLTAAPDGSIARSASPKADLLIFEVRSKITDDDMEWMSRTVEAAFEAHAQIDILIVMRDYEGAELAALFNVDALKVQAQSLVQVRRYAVVGAPAWANGMIALFDKLSPV